MATDQIDGTPDRDEHLPRLAHRLWVHWSRALVEADDVTIGDERRERWRSLWVPYDDLDEADKRTDRDLVNRFRDDPPEYE